MKYYHDYSHHYHYTLPHFSKQLLMNYHEEIKYSTINYSPKIVTVSQYYMLPGDTYSFIVYFCPDWHFWEAILIYLLQ